MLRCWKTRTGIGSVVIRPERELGGVSERMRKEVTCLMVCASLGISPARNRSPLVRATPTTYSAVYDVRALRLPAAFFSPGVQHPSRCCTRTRGTEEPTTKKQTNKLITQQSVRPPCVRPSVSHPETPGMNTLSGGGGGCCC